MSGTRSHRRVVAAWVCLALPVAGLAACSSSDSGAPQTSSTTQVASPTNSTPAGSGASGTTATAAGAAKSSARAVAAPGTLPVYWLGDTRRSTFLYRESIRRPSSGDPVEAALSHMMSGRPVDPDLRTMWQSPTRLSVRSAADGITVDVSADAFSGKSFGKRQAERSIQQLVWTATSVAQSEVPVTILVDGKKGYKAWDTVELGAPIKKVPTARAPIWIDTPTHGSVVKPGVVTIKGSANVFEGTVVIEITDATGKKVATTMGEAAFGTYQPFTAKVTLKKLGKYTLTAYSPDESEGESGEGPKMFPVTTTFTVA